jgi:DNA-binding GntR family transcriptional regulator
MAVTMQASDDWQPERPRTLVDHAIDVIMSAAARGLILPGERLTEKDLGELLNMSRVPVREALRILESQGVVTNEPYKGIRLMQIDKKTLDNVLDVRANLEVLAATRAIQHGHTSAKHLTKLENAITEMRLMKERGDAYGFAAADTAFHRTLCELADNPTLLALWQSLARQLTVIFGLSTFGKSMAEIIEEHRKLVSIFAIGHVGATEAAIREHVLSQPFDVDFEAIIEERRAKRAELKAS